MTFSLAHSVQVSFTNSPKIIFRSSMYISLTSVSSTASWWEIKLSSTPHESTDIWYCIYHLFSQVFYHLCPALYKKVPRKRQEGDHMEEDTPTCKRQATGKWVRRPGLGRWGGAMRCPGWWGQQGVTGSIQRCVCTLGARSWGQLVQDSKWYKSNLWTTQFRTNRIF